MVRRRHLSNKVAIVTGASSGIGRATALALAREGAHVTLAARTEAALQEVAQTIQALGQEALVVPTDVTQQAQVEQLIAWTIERWSRVDILVANAGQYVRRRVVEMRAADLERSMAVNFYGAVYGVLAVLPHMLARGSGHLVFVNSLDGKRGLPSEAPYVAAKFALSGFGESMRQELWGSGIHVTTIFPGRIDTPLIDNLKVPPISPKFPPEMVARAVLRGIHRRKVEVIVPGFYTLLVLINILSPRLTDWFVRVAHLEGWETTNVGSER
jgi:NADP-dependent 3-hydroxy acid dehydrogenase YdfG